MTAFIELSASYRANAAAVQQRISELRRLERQERDLEELRHLRQRIRALQPILVESRELAALTAHYYDPGYYRNPRYTI